jgi:hypothetical protein
MLKAVRLKAGKKKLKNGQKKLVGCCYFFAGHFPGVADRVSIEISFRDFGFKSSLLIVLKF